MKYLSLSIMALALPFLSIAQSKADYNWMMGYGQSIPIPPSFIYIGGNQVIATLKSSLDTIQYPAVAIFDQSASFSDTNSELNFYSNGCYIFNDKYKKMAGQDTFNQGETHDGYCKTADYYPIAQGIMALDIPNSDKKALIYQRYHILPMVNVPVPELLCAKIDPSANQGLGQVISLNEVIHPKDTFAELLTAVRHGNGRDWWIIQPMTKSNKIIRILLDPQGFKNIGKQSIGYVTNDAYWSGQAAFSPNGLKYCKVTPYNGIDLFDFDRCSGNFSNSIHIDFPDSTVFSCGAAFSPNNRFLYIAATSVIYQFDLEASDIPASRTVVAEWDGSFDATVGPAGQLLFYMLRLAPNGKIYGSVPNTCRYLHSIESPNELGLNCSVQQHSVQLPKWHAFALPNFPNYRTLDWPNSPCDTLGINDPATEKEPQHDSNWGFSPNPARAEFEIEIPIGFSHKNGVLQAYSSDGRLISQQTLYAGHSKSSIWCTDWPSGLYFLKIQIAGRIVWTERVIVQH